MSDVAVRDDGASFADIVELDLLALRANEAHRQAEASAYTALEHAREAGIQLAAAKVFCRHGEWLPWLEANFEGTRFTAAKYIRLAENWGELNVRGATHLSVRGALELLSDAKEPKPFEEVEPEEESVSQNVLELVQAVAKETKKQGLAPGAAHTARVLVEALNAGGVEGHDGEMLPAAALIPARAVEAERETALRGQAHKEEAAKRRAEKLSGILANNRPLEGLGRFNVIYADPPWLYEHVKTENRAIENHYPTMTLDDICALPVSGAAAEDCVLFLWVTSPKAAEGMRVVESWGFTYRTCMVWVKDKIGMGYYARQKHELLYIATRGQLPVPEPANRPPSVIEAPRLQHSAKPIKVYDLIEQMYPEYSKLELFGRNTRENWTTWGNQA